MSSYCPTCGEHDGRHIPRLHVERDRILAALAGEPS